MRKPSMYSQFHTARTQLVFVMHGPSALEHVVYVRSKKNRVLLRSVSSLIDFTQQRNISLVHSLLSYHKPA